MITYKILPAANNRCILRVDGEGAVSLDMNDLTPKSNTSPPVSSIRLTNFSWQTQNTIALSLGTEQPMNLYVGGRYDCNSRPDLYFSQPTSNNLNINMTNIGRCTVEYIINP